VFYSAEFLCSLSPNKKTNRAIHQQIIWIHIPKQGKPSIEN
jgi:hypothetical protein